MQVIVRGGNEIAWFCTNFSRVSEWDGSFSRRVESGEEEHEEGDLLQ
jgi:hypothetical protein